MLLRTTFTRRLLGAVATVAISVAGLATEPAPAAFQATDRWVQLEGKFVTEFPGTTTLGWHSL